MIHLTGQQLADCLALREQMHGQMVSDGALSAESKATGKAFFEQTCQQLELQSEGYTLDMKCGILFTKAEMRAGICHIHNH